MRGKVAKQLRKVARIHCGQDLGLVGKHYKDLKKAWREMHHSGALARLNKK